MRLLFIGASRAGDDLLCGILEYTYIRKISVKLVVVKPVAYNKFVGDIGKTYVIGFYRDAFRASVRFVEKCAYPKARRISRFEKHFAELLERFAGVKDVLYYNDVHSADGSVKVLEEFRLVQRDSRLSGIARDCHEK